MTFRLRFPNFLAVNDLRRRLLMREGYKRKMTPGYLRRQLDWFEANVKGQWTLSMRDDAFGRAVWFAEKKEAALFQLRFG
jgi:hypothetical protein